MKKLISLLLIVSMLVASVATLASCSSGVSIKDMENNAGEVLSNAAQQSIAGFFTDDAGVGAVLEKTADKGKYTVLLKSDDLGGELTEVKGIIYVDKKSGLTVADAGIVYSGEQLSATVYSKDNKFAVAGESLFGDATALMLDPKTLANKLSGSALAELLGMNAEAADEAGQFIKDMLGTGMLNATEQSEKLDKLYKDILDELDKVITNEKVDNIDCVVTTYSINNKNFKKVLDVVYAFASENMVVASSSADAAADTAEAKAELRAMLNELAESTDIDVDIKLAINSKTSALYSVNVKGDITAESEVTEYDYTVDAEGNKDMTETVKTVTDKYTVDADLVITDSAISLDIEIGENDDIDAVSAELTKKAANGDVKYELVITEGKGNDAETALTASYEHKKSGELTIKLETSEDFSGSPIKATVNGNLKVEKDKVVLSVSSVKVGSVTVDLEFSLTAESVDKIPEFPANAKDVVDLSKTELEAIAEKVMSSKVGMIISSLIPQSPSTTPMPNPDYSNPTPSNPSVDYNEGEKQEPAVDNPFENFGGENVDDALDYTGDFNLGDLSGGNGDYVYAPKPESTFVWIGEETTPVN